MNDIKMNTTQFILKTNRFPVNDDLERANCNEVGAGGHMMCGLCHDHGMPRWQGHFKCKSPEEK